MPCLAINMHAWPVSARLASWRAPDEGPLTEPRDGVSRRPHASMMSARPSSDHSGLRSGDLDPRGKSENVMDDAGKVVLEQKVPTEPADIIAALTSLGVSFGGSLP